jgi:peptidoglycan/LPS O-acetylase OafA/YrhL
MLGDSLGRVFDPRCNALNAWRLVLASGVILQHSWPLTGRTLDTPFDQLLTQRWVDGFFVISGFLITSSWMRNPRLSEYLAARFLRIFPGLWVCLVVVAFVIAPIGVAIQGGPVLDLLGSPGPFLYVLNNAMLNVFYVGINGTPKGVPWPGVWDGSLWTLIFELMCYAAVAALGVTGLLRRRWTIPIIFGLSVIGAALVGNPVQELQTIPQMVTRFAVCFSAGALVYQFRENLPARWSFVALSAVLVLASAILPNFRVYAALPLAYAVVVSGALLKSDRLNLRNDVSYGVYIYAWPVQQLLATAGLGALNPFAFFAVATSATVPLAVASWLLVEKRALSLKKRVTGFRRHREPATA